MTCVPDKATYRLLDANVGWAEVAAATIGLTGFRSPLGLRLAGTGTIPCSQWQRWLTPPRLAWDCRRCEWLLVTPAPSRVLRLGPCETEWQSPWPGGCQPLPLGELVAIASHGDRFAIADTTHGAVHHFSNPGARHLGTTPVHGALALAYTSDGLLAVAVEEPLPHRPLAIVLVDRQLRATRRWSLAGDVTGPLLAIRADRQALWLVCEPAPGALRLWRLDLQTGAVVPGDWAQLRRRLRPIPLGSSNVARFCILRAQTAREPVSLCFSWHGRCVDSPDAPNRVACAPQFVTNGVLVTEPLDSGIPDCRWHRIVLDADFPAGTRVRTSCATSENPQSAPQDWSETIADGETDFLVRSQPGRHLKLRIELSGDGDSTPRLRRVRIEFPRVTSIEYLPPVYRESGRVEGFTERFLALFDSVISDFDASIERFPALLDVERVPDDVLPWLGTWLDVADDPRWSARVRRRVLKALPALYAKRGTRLGLAETLRLVLDSQPGIQELGPERAFAALGGRASVGAVRLFGKAASRMRLDTSALGVAPIRSHGDPDADARSANAYRFRVLVPADATSHRVSRLRLEELVASQKPAHTLESIRFAEGGFVVGPGSTVGVGTAFGPAPASVLGGRGNIRLRRRSILAAGRSGKRALVAGARIGVGINTSLE